MAYNVGITYEYRFQVLAILTQIQVPVNAHWKAEDGSSIYLTATHMRDSGKIPRFRFWTGPSLAIATIWEVNQHMQDLSLSFSSLPPFCKSAFQNISLKRNYRITKTYHNTSLIYVILKEWLFYFKSFRKQTIFEVEFKGDLDFKSL